MILKFKEGDIIVFGMENHDFFHYAMGELRHDLKVDVLGDEDVKLELQNRDGEVQQYSLPKRRLAVLRRANELEKEQYYGL